MTRSGPGPRSGCRTRSPARPRSKRTAAAPPVGQRGLLDRLGGLVPDNAGSEQTVNKLAVRHIGDTAKESGPTAPAEWNTTGTLEGLPTSPGFEEATVVHGGG
ncbi:hypothetical protein [Streptomyces sp. BBFR102]|uniref:hypothetical protein n=1 Tax=Streptomyces sp. BBFR102 TaxID=3448171 RepID=UPI003F52F255